MWPSSKFLLGLIPSVRIYRQPAGMTAKSTCITRKLTPRPWKFQKCCNPGSLCTACRLLHVPNCTLCHFQVQSPFHHLFVSLHTVGETPSKILLVFLLPVMGPSVYLLRCWSCLFPPRGNVSILRKLP